MNDETPTESVQQAAEALADTMSGVFTALTTAVGYWASIIGPAMNAAAAAVTTAVANAPKDKKGNRNFD